MIFFACMILLMFVYFLYDIVWNDVGCLQLSLTIIVCAIKQQLCMHPSQNLVVVTMDHQSSLDSGTQW